MIRGVLIALLAMFAVAGIKTPIAAGGVASPVLDGDVYAAVVGGPLTLTGNGLGPDPGARVRFSGGDVELGPQDDGIASWTADEIRLTVPPAVRDGTIVVSASGADSAPATFRAFEYTSYPLPSGTGASEFPLAIDMDANGKLWIIEEAHSHLKWVEPPTATTPARTGKIEIPQAASEGIAAT